MPAGFSTTGSARKATAAGSLPGWGAFVQRLPGVNAATRGRWLIGAPVKRSVIGHGH